MIYNSIDIEKGKNIKMSEKSLEKTPL